MRAYNDTQMTQTRKGAMHRRILGVTLTILSASLLLAACGEEQAPVNRVEAYALPKTLFQGEWYYNKTVVDTPASRSIAWENMQGNFPNGLARIRWDIQENYLYARIVLRADRGRQEGEPGHRRVPGRHGRCLADHQALRHQALLQPHDGRGEQRPRGELHGLQVVRLQVPARGLVEEPGHRRHTSWTGTTRPSSRSPRPSTSRTPAIPRFKPILRRAQRATSTSPTPW